MAVEVLAQAGDGGSGTTMLVVGILVVFGYLASCLVFPWKSCPSCGGVSKKSSKSGKTYRIDECGRCGGAPYPRVGTRLIARRED